jgi:hypothetical protein
MAEWHLIPGAVHLYPLTFIPHPYQRQTQKTQFTQQADESNLP